MLRDTKGWPRLGRSFRARSSRNSDPSAALAPASDATLGHGLERPGTLEADAAAGPLVPQRQFWADAILLAHTGIEDQGPPCRSADADLRPTLILGAFGGKPPTAT